MTDTTDVGDMENRANPNSEHAQLPGADKLAQPSDEELIAGGQVMSIWEHLAELRSRIMRAVIIVFIAFGIALAFVDPIIEILKKPLIAVLPRGANALHFTGPLDVFTVDMKVAFLVAVVIAGPFWLYQFWKFFEPALYPRERRFVLPFMIASVAVFCLGVLFCYFAILPLSLHYLIGLGMEVGTPLITIKDYVSLLTVLIFGFGIVFEVPVLIVLLAMLDVITVEALTAYRRFIILAILLISALLVPPDPVSLVALATPVYAMYEVSILVIKALKKREAAAKS
jgi:sec-independent protein translocase protein TatC